MRKKAVTQQSYKVEKGIPMPDRNIRFGEKFPFSQMKVGDSFLIPNGTPRFSKFRQEIYYFARKYNAKNGVRITISARLTDAGLRVWRIADPKK